MTSPAASKRASGRSNSAQAAEKPLPQTLREIRHSQGVTVTQAAELTGLNKARISELERGVRWPTKAELQALGWIYGVELGVGFSVVVIGQDGVGQGGC